MNRLEHAGRWITVVILAVLTWRFARMPLDGTAFDTFLHLPDLVFHEAGHVILAPLGRTVSVLGGSLFQLLVPLVFAGVFLWQQENQFAAAVCAWWAGQNLIDLAPYIADARSLQLPLLGGRTGAEVEGHDWEYLLTTAGWLQHDVALGTAVFYAGVTVMLAAVMWALASARTARQR